MLLKKKSKIRFLWLRCIFFLFYSGNAESLVFRSKAPLLTCLYFNHSLTQSITIYVFQAKEKDDDDEQDGGGGKESDRKYFFITKLNIFWMPVFLFSAPFGSFSRLTCWLRQNIYNIDGKQAYIIYYTILQSLIELITASGYYVHPVFKVILFISE